jgi:hypothetical protein
MISSAVFKNRSARNASSRSLISGKLNHRCSAMPAALPASLMQARQLIRDTVRVSFLFARQPVEDDTKQFVAR